MSIATELTLLANSKQAIKNSINAKGGSITDSTPFADYSTAIDNLPSGGGDSQLIDLIEGDITSINIPIGTTTIKNDCFYNSPLASVNIPNTVTSIGNRAFHSTRLVSVTIPNSVTTIGGAVFQNCLLLTTATLPSGLRQISANLFTDCRALTSITIPDTVTLIQSDAFSGCRALTSITIPSSVTIIGSAAFRQTTSATFVLCLPTTPPSLSNYAFLDDSGCPIYVPAESVDAYKAATNWSTYASRIYPITQVATVDGNPVYNYEIGSTSSTTILSTEIEKMPTGTSIEFAEGLTNIAAGEINYQQVTLPSTFTGFGDSNMIGSSVTTITSNAVTPPGAFRNQLGGSGLTAIYVPSSAVDAYKEDATWSSFASIIQAIPSPPALKWTSDEEAVPDETHEISIACEDLATAGTLVKADITAADPDNLMVDVYGNAEIGDCVTTISGTSKSKAAFKGCTSLLRVTIPDSVTTIGRETFNGCSNLLSINIPDSVTDIGMYAFSGCSSLYEVTIGNGVTSIGESAFADCAVLASVTVNATTPPTLGSEAFGYTNDCPIYVPAESLDAYKTASRWSDYADRIQAIPAE